MGSCVAYFQRNTPREMAPRLQKYMCLIQSLALEVFISTAMHNLLENNDQNYLFQLFCRWIESTKDSSDFEFKMRKLVDLAVSIKHYYVVCEALQKSVSLIIYYNLC